MDLGLEGRTAFITGASSGLGLGCASALAAEGVTVAMVSRTRERIDAAAAVVPDSLPLVADITDPHTLDAAIEEAEQRLGPIDILIANGGGPPPGNFATTDLDAYDQALKLNLLPTVAMCKRLIPGMQERGYGRVVAITSIAVREPNAMLILSNTARSGLTSFLKTTAREVAADGVTINSLQPGLHLTSRLTGMHSDVEALATTVPAQLLGDPADFGSVAAFLCSDAAKFITGAAIPIDGGAAHGLQ
jgi:3-oxoacyl-[acyl-carrier protein] reductase